MQQHQIQAAGAAAAGKPPAAYWSSEGQKRVVLLATVETLVADKAFLAGLDERTVRAREAALARLMAAVA